MNGVSNLLVKIDHLCDHVPLVSSITNLIDIFQKCVVLLFMDKRLIESNHYYKHIKEKSFFRCFFLIIPFIGNISFGIYDFSKKKTNNNVLEPQEKVTIENSKLNISDSSEKESFEKLENQQPVKVIKKISAEVHDSSKEKSDKHIGESQLKVTIASSKLDKFNISDGDKKESSETSLSIRSCLINEMERTMKPHLYPYQKSTLITLFDQALKTSTPQQTLADLIRGKINQPDGWGSEKVKHILRNLLPHCPVHLKILKAHTSDYLNQVEVIAQQPINSKGEKLVCFYKTGPTEFLGNFANCPQGIQIWGHSFKCSEAAFQWRKYHLAATNHHQQDMMKDPKLQEFFTCDGEEAFRLSRELGNNYVKIFPLNWFNGERDKAMWDVLHAKFQQNAIFAQLLKSTKGAYLLEHNQATRDDYWSDNHNGKGKNILGKMLMAIRDSKPCPPPNDDSDQVRIQTYAKYANQPNALEYQIF